MSLSSALRPKPAALGHTRAKARQLPLPAGPSRRESLELSSPDPYGLDERRSARTRTLLESLRKREGLDVTITTRSALVTRDLDLFRDLSARHDLRVHMSIATLDRRLARSLDPEASRPDIRLKALSQLASARIVAGLLVEPVLPWITDDPAALDRLAGAAVAAGAKELAASPLFLKPSEVAALFPLLEEEYPDLLDRYRARYERSALLPSDYRAALADLLRRLRRKHGLTAANRTLVGSPTRGSQLSLL